MSRDEKKRKLEKQLSLLSCVIAFEDDVYSFCSLTIFSRINIATEDKKYLFQMKRIAPTANGR